MFISQRRFSTPGLAADTLHFLIQTWLHILAFLWHFHCYHLHDVLDSYQEKTSIIGKQMSICMTPNGRTKHKLTLTRHTSQQERHGARVLADPECSGQFSLDSLMGVVRKKMKQNMLTLLFYTVVSL